MCLAPRTELVNDDDQTAGARQCRSPENAGGCGPQRPVSAPAGGGRCGRLTVANPVVFSAMAGAGIA